MTYVAARFTIEINGMINESENCYTRRQLAVVHTKWRACTGAGQGSGFRAEARFCGSRWALVDAAPGIKRKYISPAGGYRDAQLITWPAPPKPGTDKPTQAELQRRAHSSQLLHTQARHVGHIPTLAPPQASHERDAE